MKSINVLAIAAFAVLLTSCATTESPSTQAFKGYTPEDILQMVKQGEPSDRIIKQLQSAGSFYPLKASELVRLHQQGVPLEVLDYMQGTYVWKVRREERFQLSNRFSAPY